MKKAVYFVGGLLILALTANCVSVVPPKTSYTLTRKCQPDKNLRYYLVYNVETAEYGDEAVLFLSYVEVANLMINKVCLVKRTLKPKPQPKIEVPNQPRERRDFDRIRVRD